LTIQDLLLDGCNFDPPTNFLIHFTGLAKTARQQKTTLPAGSVGERVKTRGTDGKPTQSLDGSGRTAVLVVLVAVRLFVFPNCFETFSRFLTERVHPAWLRALPPSPEAMRLLKNVMG
jgi:hypothetical protein